jgi:hypothetical protein
MRSKYYKKIVEVYICVGNCIETDHCRGERIAPEEFNY